VSRGAVLTCDVMLCVAAGRSEDGLPPSAGERGGGEHDQTLQCVHQVRRVHGGDQPDGGGLLWHRYTHVHSLLQHSSHPLILTFTIAA